jgi:hypothetical protein
MAHFLDEKETLRMEIRKSPAIVQEYISFLESKLHQPTVISSVCSCVRKHKLYEHNLNECIICEKPIRQMAYNGRQIRAVSMALMCC